MIELNRGDCLEVMKSIPDQSIDSIVTDPPAGISFMGKEWDHHKGGRDEWITWMSAIMRECLRVMKPGAHGLVWAIPRTSHWTATALENAGFEVRDVVTHLFGSGFPKSLDISKAIDKAAGAEREITGPKSTYRKPQISPNGNVCLKREPNETAPSTDAAKQWQGFGTALKPASEHWILIRKPCSEKTVAANVLKHGVGGLNIDASRIGFQSEADQASAKPQGAATSKKAKDGLAKASGVNSERTVFEVKQSAQGRFPANLVFSHTLFCTDQECADDCAVKGLDEQSGISKPKPSKTAIKGGSPIHGASRFFYCAKISSSERHQGLDQSGDAKRMSDARPGSPDNTGKFPDHDSREKIGNHHPTVKPKKLMSYLIRMITPPGGIVLDPFMGSGSTGLAAKECGFKFIGIEKEDEYFKIAKGRIGAAITLS
jgi:DNA modification methylase